MDPDKLNNAELDYELAIRGVSGMSSLRLKSKALRENKRKRQESKAGR